MLDLMRAWDLAQEDFLVLRPEDPLSKAVRQLLEQMNTSTGPRCAIVQDAQGRFVGTLSTHRALRAMGQELEKVGAFRFATNVDSDKAVRAVCRMVGSHTVEQHMYTKALQVNPQTPIHELLALFANNTAHFAVVVEAGRALGILELDDIFRNLAHEMIDTMPL